MVIINNTSRLSGNHLGNAKIAILQRAVANQELQPIVYGTKKITPLLARLQFRALFLYDWGYRDKF
jgi:hypothetical protein